jgi:hypothetical protein
LAAAPPAATGSNPDSNTRVHPIAKKLSAKIFLKYTDKVDSVAMIVILENFTRRDS